MDIVLNSTGNKEMALFPKSGDLVSSLDHTTGTDIYIYIYLFIYIYNIYHSYWNVFSFGLSEVKYPIHRMLELVEDYSSIALKPPGLIPVLMAGITNQSHTSLHWARCGIHLLLHMMFQQAPPNTVQLACENELNVHFLY